MPSANGYSSERWRVIREHAAVIGIVSVLAVGLFTAGTVFSATEGGPPAMIGAGAGALAFGVIVAAAFVWKWAGGRASSTLIEGWARTNGWAYVHAGRQQPAVAPPGPADAPATDQRLAAEPFPAATPLLRQGDRNYVTDVVARHLDIGPVRLANHVYEIDYVDARGNPQTEEVKHLVGLMPAASLVDPLRVTRRSAVGRLVSGAVDVVVGWGAMDVPDLENDLFRKQFRVQVSDDADPTHVFAIFDPLTQERMADGSLVRAVDRFEAEGGWLLVASRGSLDGDELGNLDAMLAALGWGAQLIAPPAADRQ